MKTNFLKKTFLCLFLILLILSSSVAFASNDAVIEPRTINEESNESNNEVTSTESNSTYISSDLFLYDTNVEVSNHVNGNVAIYGQNVNITGEIQGDLLVFANSLNISEDAMIYGNLFAYAPTLKISGVVSDVYAISSNFTIEDTGRIGRNLNIISPNINIYGKVSRDANINTSNLVFAEDIKEAAIGGNLNYWSNSEITIPDRAVNGEVKFTALESQSTEDVIWSAVSSIITGLCLSFAVIMLSIWISPDFKERLGMMIKNNTGKCFGIGLLIFFGIIVASIFLLLFTYSFGSTIAVCAIALLIIAYAISNTIFAMSISKLIVNKLNMVTKTPFVLFSLLVVLILSLLKYIPYLGTIVNIVTSIIGLGMLGMNFYKRKTLYTVDNEKNNNYGVI